MSLKRNRDCILQEIHTTVIMQDRAIGKNDRDYYDSLEKFLKTLEVELKDN